MAVRAVTRAAGRHVLPRAAHAPAVARAPRRVAGRRGVAAPGVGHVATCPCSTSSTGSPPRAARDLLTLGVTPVVARAARRPVLPSRVPHLAGLLAGARRGPRLAPRPRALRDHRARASSSRRSARSPQFETRWCAAAVAGAAPAGRQRRASSCSADPATHPFQPLLDRPWQRFALRTGLDDAAVRLGSAPRGHLGPRVRLPARPRGGLRRPRRARASSSTARRCSRAGGTTAAARDGRRQRRGGVRARPRRHLPRVVAAQGLPRRALVPRLPHLRPRRRASAPSRVTSTTTPSHEKAPYDPERAARRCAHDAADFVDVVRRRLARPRRCARRPARHSWSRRTTPSCSATGGTRGRSGSRRVLRLLPEAGVRVTTLARSGRGGPRRRAAWTSDAGSWGSGKDWRVWDGEAVRDIVDDNAALRDRVLKVLDASPTTSRDPVRDQLARTTLLALPSDWAFMVTQGLRRRLRARPPRPPPPRGARCSPTSSSAATSPPPRRSPTGCAPPTDRSATSTRACSARASDVGSRYPCSSA